jgi:hypothetical protein
MKLPSRKSFFVIAVCGALSCASSLVSAQKNLDVCRVTTDTRSLKEGYGTGIYEIGKFPVDDIENTTRKSFRYETDGRVFTVDAEVEYGDSKDVEKGKPTKIIFSLLVKLSNDKSSGSMLTPIEAGSKYRYKWGTIYVSNDVVIGDIAQHFQLTCSDGISKDGVQRGQPKWVKKRNEGGTLRAKPGS